jgi:hypothetical protein
MHVPPQWMNKHLLPLLIDNKRGEPKITPRLAALVKWVAELCNAGLQACHCTEEFTLRSICPLGHREKLAYEWPRLANPSRDPADSEILISFTATVALMSFLSYIALTNAKVTRLVSRMFDKSMISARSATMPKPYFSENHPHSVRIFIFSDLIFCYY